MGSEENDGSNNFLNNFSSGMASNSVMCSESMFKTPNGVDPFYGSGWDPIVSLSQSGNLGNSSENGFANPHYSVLMDNQNMGSGSSSHLVHFPSESGFVDVPKIPCFGSGSFSEMVGSFSHVAGSVYNLECILNNGIVMQNSEHGVSEASPNGKRKREASLGSSPKSFKEDQKETEEDERKQKLVSGVEVTSRTKLAGKLSKDNGASAGPSKENYIHVRAKRGQATNSHSLAERVRRERISERMRLLQELVPGCNKITGKAVMLDEIINYVQSLQQQVEFLSMKLATVNPELNVDIERILSKDILHLRSSGANQLGISTGQSLPHAFPGYSLGTFSAPGSTPYNPLTQNLWSNSDLQNILQAGFDSNNSGLSKMGP